MQPALLIDEILREIFQFSSEYGPGTLSTLARSCRAWREPALDHLWMRLSSPVPLLQLISGIQLVHGQYVLSSTPTHRDIICFHSYAQRVKYITHCRSVRIHPDILPFLVAVGDAVIPRANEILPSLRTARVSSPCDPFQQALSLSSQLRHLELDLGFKTKNPQVPIEACHFLEQVFHVAPELEKLSIRGSASKNMNSLVSSMLNLHTLSLRVGTSLTAETLLAVAHFPLLSELEIHAGHFDVDLLASSLCDNRSTTFPSLRKLHIRAPAAIIELFMNIIPTNTLQTLRIEAEDPADLPIAWCPIFELLCSKAANTLQNLTLEHHIELDDLDMNDNTSGDPNLNIDDNNTMDNKPPTQISFITLKNLSAIGGLRRLILDMTLPPCIYDREMETLAGWWPGLEHLDLGSVSTTGCVGRLIKYPMTLQSLVVCAQKLPKLTSLILPANANIACVKISAATDTMSTQNKLTRITLGHPSMPNPAQLARHLYRLFPSLAEVDGLGEHEEQWAHTRAALQAHRLEETS